MESIVIYYSSYRKFIHYLKKKQNLLKGLLVASNSNSHVLCSAVSDSLGPCPPGSSVHGMFQARILELVTISFSRGYS